MSKSVKRLTDYTVRDQIHSIIGNIEHKIHLKIYGHVYTYINTHVHVYTYIRVYIILLNYFYTRITYNLVSYSVIDKSSFFSSINLY